MYKYRLKETTVKEFMTEAGQHMGEEGLQGDNILLAGRALHEESGELLDELDIAMEYIRRNEPLPLDLKERILKEACDTRYTLAFVLNTLGLEYAFDPAFNRVHASNMTKLLDGVDISDEGKFNKGPSYKPAVLTDLLEK